MYINRDIDQTLESWAKNPNSKPLLLRGARQIGKSTSVRNLGKKFENFIEINFEKMPQIRDIFERNTNVKELAAQLGLISQQPVIPGKTLIFLDEIQACEAAIKSLWFFKEDYPGLHIVAAGSLLEFTLKDISSFGVGRIRSLFMYPISFGEFLDACGKNMWRNAIKEASPEHPLPDSIHNLIVAELRKFIIVGGMPASVAAWINTGSYLECASEQQDIIQSYYDDFPKYAKKVDPILLRRVLNSVLMQTGGKFTYSKVEGEYRTEMIKTALRLLCDAGIIREITRTAANGIPLGAEADGRFKKYIYLDTGLMLRLQSLNDSNSSIITEILTANATDLIHKGALAEMIVGWELTKASQHNLRYDLYYWENTSSGANSEVDYISVRNLKIIPIEVKAGTSGKMKSLRYFLDNKNLSMGVRTSLENFNTLHISTPNSTEKSIEIIPIYAINRLG